MALKGYEELRKIDVKPYCKKREGILYLNWAKCVSLLHENGATEVYWEPIPSSTGSSLRMSGAVFADKNGNTNGCYETRIKVVVDDKTWEMQTPVMNGSNPVKDNSMTSQRVWNSMCRAFVKCIAIHTGLGFDLWINEEEKTDQPFNIPDQLEKMASETKIDTIKKECAQYGIDADAWVTGNGKTWETLTEKEAATMLSAIAQKYGG